MSTLLGLDLGEKRVGVAVGDTMARIATPLTTITIRSKRHLLEELAKLIDEHGAEELVVGLPKTLKGEIGPSAQRVLDEVDWLKERLKQKIVLWDERFSTLEVERLMLDADVSSAKRKKVRDQLAAQRILQSYLDCHQR